MATWKKLQYVATKTTGVILGNLDDGIKPLGAKSEALKDLKDVKTASANSVDVAPGNTLDCARKRRLRPSGTVAKRLKYEKQANVKSTLQDLKQENEDLKDRISEMETMLNRYIVEEKNWNEQKTEIRGYALKLSQTYRIPVRIFGLISNQSKEQLTEEQLDDVYQRFIFNPEFMPFKVQYSDPNNPRTVLKQDDPMVKELREKYGERICEDVIRAVGELESKNATGRYPVALVWDFEKQKEMELGDIANIMYYIIKDKK